MKGVSQEGARDVTGKIIWVQPVKNVEGLSLNQ